MNTCKSPATDNNLLVRLKDWEDHASWQNFFDTYSKLIHGQSISAGLMEFEAQEVVQDTLIEIGHQVRNSRFDAQRGSFRKWLFRMTHWRIANQFKKRTPGMVSMDSIAADTSDGSDETGTDPSLVAEADQSWDRDWHEAMLKVAMKNLRNKIGHKDFQVFASLVQHNWPVAQVVRIFGMNRAHVYVVKLRVAALVKKEIARLENGNNTPGRTRI